VYYDDLLDRLYLIIMFYLKENTLYVLHVVNITTTMWLVFFNSIFIVYLRKVKERPTLVWGKC